MVQMETLQTEITKTKNGDSKKLNLVTMQIKRTVKGTRLFIQSDIFEDFFKQFGKSGEQFRDGEDKIQELYSIPAIERGSKFWYNITDEYLQNLKTSDGYTNLAFLKVVGISKGCNFKINNLQSKQAIKSFTDSFKTDVVELYKQFVKPEIKYMSISINEGKD